MPVDDPLEGGAGGPERLHAPHTQVLKIQPVPYSLLEQFISVISADLVWIISMEIEIDGRPVCLKTRLLANVAFLSANNQNR